MTACFGRHQFKHQTVNSHSEQIRLRPLVSAILLLPHKLVAAIEAIKFSLRVSFVHFQAVNIEEVCSIISGMADNTKYWRPRWICLPSFQYQLTHSSNGYKHVLLQMYYYEQVPGR